MVIRVFMELHKRGRVYIFIPWERYTHFVNRGACNMRERERDRDTYIYMYMYIYKRKGSKI